MTHFRTDFAVLHKGDVNLVTEMDIAAENLIISKIQKAFPDHAILAEESRSSTQRGSHTWIVDPLDGTTNYAHGLPAFSVSIGLEIEGTIEWGIVYNPNLGEVFTAVRGGGAFLNGERLAVSGTRELDKSMLATGFPYDIRTAMDNNLNYFHAFMLRSQAVRRVGSAAMDLSYVAAGRFDGFWELRLHPWDCAAGYLLVTEAGGVVTDFSGKRGGVYDSTAVASNGFIHEQMLEVIREIASLTSSGGDA